MQRPFSLRPFLIAPALLLAAPAHAQIGGVGPFDLSASATVTSDYRFRGISRSDRDVAVQGGLTVTHESGLYAGVWGSTVKGWGAVGDADAELNLVGGYSAPLGPVTLDAGMTWYLFPGSAPDSDYVEPFVRARGDLGPASLTLGLAYAPKQRALGNAMAGVHPDARPGAKGDNLYLWGDLGAGVPGTPVTLKAHLGYSDGNPGLSANGFSLAPTGHYMDWKLGADIAAGPLTFGLAYVDTDIGASRAATLPGLARPDGSASAAGGRVLVSASIGF